MRTTQKIPAWSANLSANGPKDWQAELGRKAFALGISSGELLRQLLMAGALVKFPELGRKLIAAHRRYYPARKILATAGSAALLLLFVSGWWMCGHDNQVRAARGLRMAKHREEQREG